MSTKNTTKFEIQTVMVKQIGDKWTVYTSTECGQVELVVPEDLTIEGIWTHIHHEAFGKKFLVTIMNYRDINKPNSATIQFFDDHYQLEYRENMAITERGEDSNYFIY